MKKEIYFFSNAGGTIELFNGLCNELEQQFDCFPFEYPGHSSDRNGFCDSIEKRFYIVDHSTNGTFIGSRRLEKGKTYILLSGQQFSLGNHICDLEVGWKDG